MAVLRELIRNQPAETSRVDESTERESRRRFLSIFRKKKTEDSQETRRVSGSQSTPTNDGFYGTVVCLRVARKYAVIGGDAVRYFPPGVQYTTAASIDEKPDHFQAIVGQEVRKSSVRTNMHEQYFRRLVIVVTFDNAKMNDHCDASAVA